MLVQVDEASADRSHRLQEQNETFAEQLRELEEQQTAVKLTNDDLTLQLEVSGSAAIFF